IADRGRFLRAGGVAEGFSNFQELVFRHAAMFFDELRRVARKVPLQHLVNAPWMLQRVIRVVLGFIGGFSAAVLAMSAAGARMTGHLAHRTLFLRRSLVQPRVRL